MELDPTRFTMDEKEKREVTLDHQKNKTKLGAMEAVMGIRQE